MPVNSLVNFLNDSHQPVLSHAICYDFDGTLIFNTFAALNFLLLLPLSTCVIHVGLQRWRQRRSSSAIKATSHTDIFTYHTVFMEFFTLLGTGLYSIAEFMKKDYIMLSGFYLFSFIIPGQTNFHSLACIERYLAVVHPITYLRLRGTAGVRIRNVSIFLVWLMGFGWICVMHAYLPHVPVEPLFFFFSYSLLVSCFCSLSVLRVLRHPSPGDGGGDRVRVDQSKRRAFLTLTAITGGLLFRFAGFLVSLALHWSFVRMGGDGCVVLKGSFWFGLPSSLVLPLLFLHRAGKLPWQKSNTASEPR